MYGCYAVPIAFYFFIHLTCLFVYIATYLCHRSTDSTRKPPLMQSNHFGKNLSLSIKGYLILQWIYKALPKAKCFVFPLFVCFRATSLAIIMQLNVHFLDY